MAPEEALAGVRARVDAIRALLGQRPGAASGGSRFAAALDAAQGVQAAGVGIPGGGGLLSADGTTGGRAVELARSFSGTPYVWGGDDPSGFDCSGLVQHVYGQLGIELPRVSRDQARAGQPVPSLADARPGDLVAFGEPVDHIGIYAGAGEMVVAPHRGDVVRVQRITATPTAIRRVVDPTGPPSVDQAPVPLAELFHAAGARYGLPAGLLAAVARTESGLDPNARSGAGALGLMQLMPATAAGLGVDPLDPTQAVDGAARLLAGHLRRFGTVPLALAAYNAGGGAVARHGGIPPFKETQAYVQRVLAGVTS